MRIPFALTASAAESTPDGRVWILGGDFDTIFAAQFPITLPTMTVVVKILFEPGETGRSHTVRTELWDQDGEVVQQPLVHTFTPERNATFPTRNVGSLLTLNMQGLSFPNPGDYAFHVLVDDHLMATIPIYVMQQGSGG
jgi:hypothetical protein